MRLPLPEPKSFGWTMKTLASARTSFDITPDRVFHLHIDHDLIRNVTPEMLEWWFRHIGGDMEYRGQTHSRYQVWHPLDHIHWKLMNPDRQPVGVGSKFRIVEAFGRHENFRVDSVEDVVKLDRTGIRLVRRIAGIEIFSLNHQFIAEGPHTRYISDMIVGTDHPVMKFLFNRLIRPFIFSEAMGHAWLKHNIEEVGNFEYFLPELYKKVA